jgi:hypothetical protein
VFDTDWSNKKLEATKNTAIGPMPNSGWCRTTRQIQHKPEQGKLRWPVSRICKPLDLLSEQKPKMVEEAKTLKGESATDWICFENLVCRVE